MGRIVPIVEIEAPVSGRKCVAYQDVVEAHVMGRRGSWRKAASNVVGAFIVADASGSAIVWPSGASLIIAESWNSREDLLQPMDGNDKRRESEKAMHAGETAYVLGSPHTYEALVARLKQDCGYMPGDLLQALLKREDLKNLPCFFADGSPFVVANRTYDELSGSLMPGVFDG